jgi:DNA (cytosine-5)-methyltransferase 1
MDITYGSVCSGIEAATLAWKPLGMRAIWFGRRILRQINLG